MVQIHSPRPISATYFTRKSEERLVHCQALDGSNSFAPIHSFASQNQCGALRSLLRLQVRLYGQYGQRHHIRSFAWKFEALLRPSYERRGTPLIFYLSLSLTASPIRIVPPNTMSARNPPRCKSPVRTPFVVSASRYWQGSHKRFPISRTEPTWNSRPTK